MHCGMRTFSLHIHSSTSTTPSLAFETVSDETAAQTVAARVLAESPTRLLVKVREEDRLLFTLDRDGGLFRSPHVGRQPSDV
jgi:hypothetical protein